MYRFMALTIGLLVCGNGWSQTVAGISNPGFLSPSRIDPFNYVIGTQTFSPAYQFTKKPSLLETAEAIHDMGATVIKFDVSRRYARRYGVSAGPIPPIHSLTELVRNEPAYRKVLDMPFAYYILWAHTFSSRGDKRD